MTHQIITANRLIDGAVIYFTANGAWSARIADSQVFDNTDTADQALLAAMAFVKTNEILDPYLIDISQDGFEIKPVRYREIIRAAGPSTFPVMSCLAQGNETGAVAA